MTVLDRKFSFLSQKEKKLLAQIILPTIVFMKPSNAAIKRLLHYNYFDPHCVFSDGSNLLHRLMRQNHDNLPAEYEKLLRLLIDLKVKPDLVDKCGNSAVFYGIENKNFQAVEKLISAGGTIVTNCERIQKAILESDI